MLDVGAGVIDPDFSGEVRVMLFNHSDYEFLVRPGDRIAQLVLEKIMIVDAKITVKQPDETVRGVKGFGSTGGYPAGPAIGLNGDPVPPMPRSNKALGHQPNLQGIPTFYACVARRVTKKEQAGNDKACSSPQGMGRVVFEGCFVKDQANHWAMFSEATSCPATMAACVMHMACCLVTHCKLVMANPPIPKLSYWVQTHVFHLCALAMRAKKDSLVNVSSCVEAS